MPGMPLAHVSWAIADNADRKPCDAFFQDVFGAEIAYEMLMTPEAQAMGLDREESLMMVGDTMIVPIAPAGKGAEPGAPIGEMLRRSAAPMRWLGVALKVADLKAADAWFSAKGFKLHYDPGMEAHYFLIGRGQALGMRIEVLAQDLPNDPRRDPAWTPAKWREVHPLAIEGLQAIGLSAPSLEEARAVFAGQFDWPEIGTRALPEADADCVAFAMGDTVLEAMRGRVEASPVAVHARETKGIHNLVFKVRDASAAAEYLRGKGLDLIGDVADRFAIAPEQAHGRLIWFTGRTPVGYPPVGSNMREPARFPAVVG
ncbi:glyoxalase [Novosphingobium album (ex Liu et al. 2023)]|uniref:Glyoxalase n=1 Tax=Novosphingobium album (ex Liu et al. 2023) TaxID=3031130 RepID=A0ABT5WJY0_9SPHN|nr:glyoxalase [Novosphingobium album (ex Liu et al. 2023)]MDE8650349.1 glyoxalase [Novosphingobium album (ex Liu et al. 2023)]